MEEASMILSKEGNSRMDAMGPSLITVTNRTVFTIVLLVFAAVLSSIMIGVFMTRSIASRYRK